MLLQHAQQVLCQLLLRRKDMRSMPEPQYFGPKSDELSRSRPVELHEMRQRRLTR